MRVFRFMPRQYAEAAVQHGRLRLSTFASVSDLESQLADPFDGAFVRRDSLIKDGLVSDLERERWLRMGIRMVPNVRDPRFLSVTNVSQSNGYMLCCTDTHLNDYLRGASPENDTILEIADLAELARGLTDRDPILQQIAREPAGPGRCRVGCGPVKYETIEGDSYSEDEPHPMVKALRFADEREVRAVWCSDQPVLGPLDVEVPEIRPLLRIL